MSKKTFLIVSVFLVLALLVFVPNDLKYSYCGYDRFECWKIFNLIKIIFFFGPALLISSFVIFRSSESIFHKWKKFTLFFIPVYLAIVILMPWSVGDEIAGFTKGMVALVLSILYLASSLIYVFILTKKEKSI